MAEAVPQGADEVRHCEGEGRDGEDRCGLEHALHQPPSHGAQLRAFRLVLAHATTRRDERLHDKDWAARSE